MRSVHTLRDITRALRGKKIVGVAPRAFRTGRPEHPWTTDPEIHFEDGSFLTFTVRETESGEYGVEMTLTGPPVRLPED